MHYYNFKTHNLPNIGAMRITEEKLIKFDNFLDQFQKPNRQAFIAFVELIKKHGIDILDFP
ncbi:hypothetical protein ALTERO38_50235 [Alteromonas sp. 38]|nr:hypothetical protein ALTER154_81034 [Alteromonas sp. 154]VXB25329.1 hypothetical protein ALTERO38_50235 [Alteromonas sp. 38]